MKRSDFSPATQFWLRAEPTDANRLEAIRRTMRECGQRVTEAAVLRQFRREVHRDPEL